jgi:hypothetical protein
MWARTHSKLQLRQQQQGQQQRQQQQDFVEHVTQP